MTLEELKQHVSDGFKIAARDYNRVEDKVDALTRTLARWRITTLVLAAVAAFMVWLAIR